METLALWEGEKEIGTGLNRTMQYGNGQEILRKIKDIGGLNRTMQYGN